MKNPFRPRQRKFMYGLIGYAAIVWIFNLLPPAFSLFGIALLGFLTFALLWWQHCKPILTVILIAALALAPMEGRCQSSGDDHEGDAVAIACAVIIVGGVIVYGLWKLCKAIPTPPPQKPPPPACTNCPPSKTNTNKLRRAMSVPGIIMPDRQISTSTNWQTLTLAVQSSTDGANWRPEVFITNWIAASDHVCVAADTNGNPLLTNWNRLGWTNDAALVDLSDVWSPPTGDRVRLWRMVDLQ